MPIDDAQFKLAMSHFASGVTVVTTEHDGQLFGMTVASFASLSLHPPLVLVCLVSATSTHAAITAAGHFGVSILSKEQADLSSRFASRVEDRFAGVAIQRGELGVPLLENSITSLACILRGELPGGDHTICVGEVVELRTSPGEPLVYYRSGYRELRF